MSISRSIRSAIAPLALNATLLAGCDDRLQEGQRTLEVAELVLNQRQVLP